VGVVSRWLLAVGRSVPILHNSRNNINVHTQHIFSGLKYLDRSKIYSAFPDMPNKYLDPI
jgi:hypothetical protein